MNSNCEAAATSLDQLASQVLATIGDDRPLNQIWGWNLPPLSRSEIAEMIRATADTLRALKPEEIGTSLDAILLQVPSRAEFLRAQCVPNIAGVHSLGVVTQIEQLLSWIERPLRHITPTVAAVDWEAVAEQKLLPKQLGARIRTLEARLTDLEPRTVGLSEKVGAIEGAYSAAEDLPTVLDDLKEGRAKLEETRRQAEGSLSQVSNTEKASEGLLNQLKMRDAEAQILVKRCQEAHRFTTSVGLAASFRTRAESLAWSIRLWVALLVVGLTGVAVAGYTRLHDLREALIGATGAETLWPNIVLSFLSIAAPVWLSWVATKQINQRSKLQEDYAFKASVAMAYEGYRREAARFDRQLEARLFGSALTRLEEAPLRLVEGDDYGSPWHELVAHPSFKKALEAVPEFKNAFTGLLRRRGAEVTTAAE